MTVNVYKDYKIIEKRMKKCEFDELMDRCCTSQSMVIGHGRESCTVVLSSVHCSCHPLKRAAAAARVAPG